MSEGKLNLDPQHNLDLLKCSSSSHFRKFSPLPKSPLSCSMGDC